MILALLLLMLLIIFLSPRLILVLIWIFNTARIDAMFESFLIPLLGIIFLPFTTLAYVLVWSANGVSFLGWLLVGFGLLIDITSWRFGSRRTKTYYVENKSSEPKKPKYVENEAE